MNKKQFIVSIVGLIAVIAIFVCLSFGKGLARIFRVERAYIENNGLRVSAAGEGWKEELTMHGPDDIIVEKDAALKDFYTIEYKTCDASRVGKECSLMRMNLFTGAVRTIERDLADPDSRIAWAKQVSVESNSLYLRSTDGTKSEQLTFRSDTDTTVESNPKFFDPFRITYFTCTLQPGGHTRVCSLVKRNLVTDREVTLASGLDDENGVRMANVNYGITADGNNLVLINGHMSFRPNGGWVSIVPLDQKGTVIELAVGDFEQMSGFDTPVKFISPANDLFFVVGRDKTLPKPDDSKPATHIYNMRGGIVLKLAGSEPEWLDGNRVVYKNWKNEFIEERIKNDAGM